VAGTFRLPETILEVSCLGGVDLPVVFWVLLPVSRPPAPAAFRWWPRSCCSSGSCIEDLPACTGGPGTARGLILHRCQFHLQWRI